jgi:hypothetical protein
MYENIIFLPLDLPKLNLDIEKVMSYFETKKYLDQDWLRADIKKYSESLDDEFEKIFPGIDKTLRSLPFFDYDNQLNIHLYNQIKYNRPHQDPITKKKNPLEFGPASYKNWIIRDKLETFYLLPNSTNPDIVQYDNRPISSMNPVFPLIPDDTDWFALNNHNGYHGSILAPKEYRKITLFFAGPLDKEKHFDLLERSIHKYQSYIVYN